MPGSHKNPESRISKRHKSDSLVHGDEAAWLEYFDRQMEMCRKNPKDNVFGVDIDNTPLSFYEWMRRRGKTPQYSHSESAENSDAEFLATYGIVTESDWKQWAIRNHPDRGGDTTIFAAVCSVVRSFARFK